jgi:hypothetical protein
LSIKTPQVISYCPGDIYSHILKFGRRPDMHMMINEFLCMKLAELVKLPVPGVSLRRFGEPVLVVERFDRRRRGDKVDRLHRRLPDARSAADLQTTRLKNLGTAILERMASLPLGDDWSREEMDFARELIEKIKWNAKRFLAIAEELPQVRL